MAVSSPRVRFPQRLPAAASPLLRRRRKRDECLQRDADSDPEVRVNGRAGANFISMNITAIIKPSLFNAPSTN
jgi:hypothetical protein